MSYKDINIEKTYETTEKKEELLENFYIPFLQETVQYSRIAGFFSSSSLAIASKGIEGLIKNGGKMRLLISPRLSEQDFEIIRSTKSLNEEMNLFSNFDLDKFPQNDNLLALSWLLANGRLEIKIVVDKRSNESLFHQKVGIGCDAEGNIVSFSGSINETAQAWLNNIEEFKTFKSWEDGQIEYLTSDLKKFNSYWNDEKTEVAYVFELPDDMKEKIIKVVPRDINDLSIMKKYQKHLKEEDEKKISLFEHQKRAIDKWIENDYRLLMEMATGTGKTRTAIGGMLTLKDKIDKFLVVVSTPQNILSKQWKNDIENELNIQFDKSMIADGTNSKWRQELEIAMIDINTGMYKNSIIFTTHDTSSTDDFTNIIINNKGDIKILFICDEVHAIGSGCQREALLQEYEYRIGLSATPERMYDAEGTSIIREYFGNKSFEFTIHDALYTINPLTGKPFLNAFYYYPRFVELSVEEKKEYSDYSRKLAVAMMNENTDKELIERLMIKRADIVKNAINKEYELENIINYLNNDNIKDTIIFASDKQIGNVLEILADKNISRSKITEQESTHKKVGINGESEREAILNHFRKGFLQVLVGIKCLDEGIDIKNARIAILMASSTNPREYVQRVGRVIRVNKNKDYSIIYDLIVKTVDDNNRADMVLKKEARRAFMIAKDAVNFEEVKRIFERNGVNLDGDQQ